MYRKLSYRTLTGMDGIFVKVHDLEYDSYDQICQVKVKYKWQKIPKSWKFFQIVIGVDLIGEDEEFIYSYNLTGKCLNGEFEVYSLKEIFI